MFVYRTLKVIVIVETQKDDCDTVCVFSQLPLGNSLSLLDSSVLSIQRIQFRGLCVVSFTVGISWAIMINTRPFLN